MITGVKMAVRFHAQLRFLRMAQRLNTEQKLEYADWMHLEYKSMQMPSPEKNDFFPSGHVHCPVGCSGLGK